MQLRRAEFDCAEVEKIDTSEMVVLNSGGPLMKMLVDVGDEDVLCEWEDGGKIGRAVIPKACLSRLVPAFPESARS